MSDPIIVGPSDGDFDDAGVDTTERTDYHVDKHNHTGYAQVLEEWVNTTLSKTYTVGHDVFAETIAAGQLRHLLKDGHGSTRMLINALGVLLAAAQDGASQPVVWLAYDAYGNALNFDPATALTTLLYSGEQFDQLTGLQYLRARYYNPANGRFNRLDPYGGNSSDPQSLHKYLYAHGDPIQMRDPSGNSAIFGVLVGALLGWHFGRHAGTIIGFLDGFMDARNGSSAHMLDVAIERMETARFWGGVFGAIEGAFRAVVPCPIMAAWDIGWGLVGCKRPS